MQFDDFDKKIKEAAEHHHPAYDEKAWDKMEKLLDKHLPNEKDDRRRIFFLLLLFLLTGAGVYLAITTPWKSKSNLSDKINVSPLKKAPEQSSSTSTKEVENKSVKETATPETDQSTLTTADDKTKTPEESGTVKLKSSDKNSVSKTSEGVKNNRLIIPRKKLAGVNKDEVAIRNTVEKLNNPSAGKKFKANTNDKDVVSDNSTQNKTKNITAVATPQKNVVADDTKSTNQDNILPADKPAIDNTAVNNNTTVPIIKNADSVSQKKTDAVVKIDGEKKSTEEQKNDIKKPGKQRKSAFGITFTAGPDLSTVGLNRAGKIMPTYGAGLSYSLNRFTLRSGFYVSRKVYTAGPDDYHPPKHNWAYYVDLNKIDADCKVYEIPVTLSYNFSQTRTHNWFGSAGLSTYLMKRETYDYYYKNPVTQMPDYKTWTFNNANKHFFTILNLSAGYERKLNRTLSVIAEPYIKIPIDGIGFGNVKLNSAGILVTLSIKPFAGKK